MAIINGLTAEAMQAIVNATIVDASVNGSGHLILTLHDGSEIDAGLVKGDPGSDATVPDATDSVKGKMRFATDAETVTGTETEAAVTPASLASLDLDTGFRLSTTVKFTSSGTFSKASYPGIKAIRVRLVGGGGAGGSVSAAGASAHGSGAGGGGGGYAESFILAASLGSSETVTIGAGGSAVAGTTGNAGGTSSFGSLVASGGGGGGQSVSNYATANVIAGASGGVGGVPTAGDLRIEGSGGATARGLNSLGESGVGGGTLLGAMGAGMYTGAGSGSVTGTAGKNYGSGGNGALNNASGAAALGGAGAPGIIIVEVYV